MQIPGLLIPSSYPLPVEQRLERDARVIPFVPSQARTQVPLTPRAVPNIQQAEPMSLGLRAADPIRLAAGNPHTRRALLAYESAQRVQVREDLRAFVGIDDYA
ncbi:hypothetical protein [Thiocystis violascens]|uniref:Uncharacterized protein n=1 Tax=Thiocystis violascens (strain ATCC 17096 / DSM 198 / 6111) TaxID=765911 RepID=I3Y745_THIV6|nr:hypothetical protein [Thiocystis violascens]AFL72813.1 hypothetical protein Thivi_0761 [Thiocystis violascens DSM 198]